MSVKLFLLKSGEYVVSDGKELISDEKPCGYLLENPFKVTLNAPIFSAENSEESSVQVSLSPWIILTEDKQIPIPFDWVVTVVDPLQNLKNMYEEQVNGECNQNSSISQ
jgi:hypothetical protein